MIKLVFQLVLLLVPYSISFSQVFQWVDKVGLDGTGNDNGKAIEVDSEGNICLVGLLKNNSRFGEGASAVTLNGYGTHDIFLARYTNNGDFLWARRHGSIGSDSGQDLVLDHEDNLYVTGYFSNTADFSDTTLVSLGGADIFVMSTDVNGNFRWVTTFNGALDDQGLSITMGEDSMLYVSGYYTNKLYYNNYADSLTSFGSSDVFVAKLDKLGNVIWVKTYGSFTDDQGYDIQYHNGRLYTTGYFKSTGNFGGLNVTAGLAKDIFISCLDTSGVGIWVKKEGGNKNDAGQVLFLKDNFIYLYLESNFNITISGNPYTQMLSNAVGNIDGYLVKYDLLGNYIDSRQIASKFKDHQQSVFVDDRFVYVGLISEGNLHIEGADSLMNMGGEDIFLLAFDHNLNKKWHKQIKNTQYSGKYPSLHDMDTDSLGNLFITGGFLDSTLFDTQVEVASGWSVDVYLAKISPFPQTDVVSPNKVQCINLPLSFSNNSTYNTNYYEWHFPGSLTPVSNAAHPQVIYANPGSYDFYLITSDGLGQDSVYYSNTIIIQDEVFVELGNDTTLCFGDTLLLNYVGSAPFVWSTGSIDSTITVQQPGIYYLTFDSTSCNLTDSIAISYYSDNTPILPLDSTVCLNQEVILILDSVLYTNITWSNSITTPEVHLIQAGNYFADVIDSNGCSFQSSVFNLSHFNSILPSLGGDSVLCNNETMIADPGSGFQNYLWSNGLTSGTIMIDTSGDYYVTVEDVFGCTFTSDTLHVTEENCLSVADPIQDEINLIINQDGVWVNSNGKKVSCFLFGVDGKLLFRTVSEGSILFIDTSVYSKQVFILHIAGDNLIKTVKF